MGMDLVQDIYRLTALFPDSEKFGLASQMRRSAISIPSNIAEGTARSSDKELLQFLYYSRGSISELDTQAEIAFRVGYFSDDDRDRLNQKIQDTGRMLSGFIRKVKQDS